MQPFSMGFYRGANSKLAHCSLMLYCSSIHVPAFTLCLISHCISYNLLTPSSTGICKSQGNMMFHWDLYQVPLELVLGSTGISLEHQYFLTSINIPLILSTETGLEPLAKFIRSSNA